jgi:hypothetical protein
VPGARGTKNACSRVPQARQRKNGAFTLCFYTSSRAQQPAPQIMPSHYSFSVFSLPDQKTNHHNMFQRPRIDA